MTKACFGWHMVVVCVQEIRTLCGKEVQSTMLVRAKALEVVGSHLINDDDNYQLGMRLRLDLEDGHKQTRG